MSYLVLDRLTKTYGDAKAIDGMSLAVEKSEFVSLLGPSGCGKTTTLQIIAGFLEPSSAESRWTGGTCCGFRPPSAGSASSFRAMPCFRT